MSRVVLSMIVKNEEDVIERALKSAATWCHTVVLCDTGSTDKTVEVARAAGEKHGIKVVVFHDEWKDFATNRNLSLVRARDIAGPDGYITFLDADDEFVYPTDGSFVLPELTGAVYAVTVRLGNSRYKRFNVVKSTTKCVWVGRIHECLSFEGELLNLEWPEIRCGSGGARSKDPKKFLKDAEVLTPPQNAREVFYLAQSYRHAGVTDKALEWYRARAAMKNEWEEETWLSMLEIANITRKTEDYLSAQAFARHRNSPLVHLAEMCLAGGHYNEAFMFATLACGIDEPKNDRLWYDTGMYYSRPVSVIVKCHDEDPRLAKDALTSPMHPRAMDTLKSRLESVRVKPPASRGRWDPRSGDDEVLPMVLVAILAKQKGPILKEYLQMIEALDYPKKRMKIHVRTNNNTDNTRELLEAWLDKVGKDYAHVEIDASDVTVPVEKYGVHEWNPDRFKVLSAIRQHSLKRALDLDCQFYFVCDVDNFVAPCTLRELVKLNLPIVGPLLRHEDVANPYSNYHHRTDANGYFFHDKMYNPILQREVRGIIDVDVIHCTYLVRADVIPHLSYNDGSGRYEYVIFSDSARKSGIPQYLDTRRVYGFLTLDENLNAHARLSELDY